MYPLGRHFLAGCRKSRRDIRPIPPAALNDSSQIINLRPYIAEHSFTDSRRVSTVDRRLERRLYLRR